MTDPSAAVAAAAFLDLVAGQRGHFRLESGHHGRLWLDLDPLFADPRRVEPLVTDLAAALRPHDAAVVCGPLLGGAFLAQLIARALDAEFAFTQRVVPAAGADRDALFQARYVLPPALAARVRGKRVAIVDDVMSAGSALRGTYVELRAHGATVVAAGALLVLGATGERFFVERGVAVKAVAREDYALWPPNDCPLCAAGVPVEDAAAREGDSV